MKVSVTQIARKVIFSQNWSVNKKKHPKIACHIPNIMKSTFVEFFYQIGISEVFQSKAYAVLPDIFKNLSINKRLIEEYNRGSLVNSCGTLNNLHVFQLISKISLLSTYKSHILT